MVYILAFLKYAIYGTSVFFTGALEESAGVLDILSLRFLMSFVFMWLMKVIGIIKIKIGVKDFFLKNERRPYMKSILLAALFEPVLYMLFETVGISLSTDITTAVILSLSPIASCVAESLILKEKNSLLQKLFLGLVILGVIYIALNSGTRGGSDSPLGILFLVAAVLCGSLFGVFSRMSSKNFTSMEITYVSAMLGTLIFNAVNVFLHIIRGDILNYFAPYFDLQNIIGFVFLAILSTVVATGFNNYCLSKMQLSTMAAFSGVSTFVTIIIGVIFRDERIHYYHLIGLTLILVRMVGVSVISIKKIGRKRKNGLSPLCRLLNKTKADER